MYGRLVEKVVLLRQAAAGMLLWAGILSGQNLLAVMDLQNTGNVPQQLISEVCDKISASLAADTSYILFDRTMIPELLKQLSIDQSAATCSEVQCLSLIGSMIGANTVTGGTIAQTETTMEITLKCVDVGNKKLKNTVSLSTTAPMEVLIDNEVPALVQSLMQPPVPQPVAEKTDGKKSILRNPLMRNPLTYAGVVFLGGVAAGGTYYYKHYYKAGDEGTDDIAAPPVESSEVPDGDAPKRTRGEGK